jgi:acetyltransferase
MNVISMASARSGTRRDHVHRYPTALVDRVQLGDGRRLTIRPVLPQDAPLQQAFVRSLSPAARYLRFHGPLKELPEETLRYMTDVDYESHLALLATSVDAGGREFQVAEARWVRRDEDEADTADFALAVADDWQRVGLGRLLLGALADSASGRGVRRLSGDVLFDNEGMCRLLKRSGWRLARDRYDARLLAATLDLQSAAAESAPRAALAA